jgi:hypothetical protein
LIRLADYRDEWLSGDILLYGCGPGKSQKYIEGRLDAAFRAALRYRG